MTLLSSASSSFFTPFKSTRLMEELPNTFTLFVEEEEPHPLCLLAAKELQVHLKNQEEWNHNFGLDENEEGAVIGKMFGVLVVKTTEGELGYLAAFSGKLAGANHHRLFVPPVFDSLTDGGFLNLGMEELRRINNEVVTLEAEGTEASKEKINDLKTLRRNNSIALQQQLFEAYHFLNLAGEEKSLNEIFKQLFYKSPPSGAGECAGLKLLQYAFQQKMKPLVMAEFWWGKSPKSSFWKHGQFYPCCKEKCEPILAHMLKGIDEG